MTKNREELLATYLSDDDRVLAAKALDKLTLAEKKWGTVLGDFYDPGQAHLVSVLAARRSGESQLHLYGGYGYAERQRACFAHCELEVTPQEFGLAVLKVHGNFDFVKVGHRDFLGALLSLGLRREKLGDVVACDLGAYIVVDELVADHVRTQFSHVGRASVSVDYCDIKELEIWQPKFTSQVAIAASARLDAITAAVYNLSRSESSQLVARGLVKLNHIPCTSGAKEVKPSDIVSARGYGRVYVRQFIGLTQKGRLRLRFERPE